MTRVVCSCESMIMKRVAGSPLSLRAIGPEPWNAAYVNHLVVQQMVVGETAFIQHHQFRWLWNLLHQASKELCGRSLEELGINRWNTIFVSLNNWENPSTGSAGLGWEVWLDGMEITQFTYFQRLVDWQLVRYSEGHLRFGTFGFLHPKMEFCLMSGLRR